MVCSQAVIQENIMDFLLLRVCGKIHVQDVAEVREFEMLVAKAGDGWRGFFDHVVQQEGILSRVLH